MSQEQQTLLTTSYNFTKQQLIKLGTLIRTITSPIIDKIQPKITPLLDAINPYIQKSKQVYKEHKVIILVVGAVTITYLITRPRKEQQCKQKKKKQPIIKKQIGNKTFISDNSENDNLQQPSTGTRPEVQSSGRQMINKKKTDNKFLQRIQSSSQEQQSGDKIFFQVYKTYQVSRND